MQKYILLLITATFIILMSSCGKRKCNTCPQWSIIENESIQERA